jgi:hypothetical protein
VEIFAAIFEAALGLLFSVMQRVTDFLAEIIGLVEYATSASYRAEIDKQYEGQSRWLKWWALPANRTAIRSGRSSNRSWAGFTRLARRIEVLPG